MFYFLSNKMSHVFPKLTKGATFFVLFSPSHITSYREERQTNCSSTYNPFIYKNAHAQRLYTQTHTPGHTIFIPHPHQYNRLESSVFARDYTTIYVQLSQCLPQSSSMLSSHRSDCRNYCAIHRHKSKEKDKIIKIFC